MKDKDLAPIEDALVFIGEGKEYVLQAFTTGDGLEGILEITRQEVDNFEHDMSTVGGRRRTASLSRKVATLSITLDGMAKDLVSGIKKKANNIDSNRRSMRNELKIIKEEARRPLTEWEEQELRRIARHEDMIRYIAAMSPSGQDDSPPMTLQDLVSALDRVTKLEIGPEYEEFQKRASVIQQQTMRHLQLAIKNEETRIELERLQQENLEREQREAEESRIRQDKERKEREAKEQRERDERAAKEQHEREERIAREATEKAKKEAELEAKRKRDDEEKAKREAQLEAERKRDEALAKVKKERDEAERARKEAIAKAEEEKKRAEQAEFDRLKQEAASAAQAEFAAKQAVLDEQRRVADEQAKEEAKRKVDEEKWRKKREKKEHVLRIQQEAYASLYTFIEEKLDTHDFEGCDLDAVLTGIMIGIVEHKVKHVTIKY